MTMFLHLHFIALETTQLWENEDVIDEFKKQLCIKRYDKHFSLVYKSGGSEFT